VELWAPSLAAAWAASAAVTAVYDPGEAAPVTGEPPDGPDAAEDVFERATAHGDEHVIKLADTAVDVYHRTGDPAALGAALRATDLVAPA
jgi:hypothetical protein